MSCKELVNESSQTYVVQFINYFRSKQDMGHAKNMKNPIGLTNRTLIFLCHKGERISSSVSSFSQCVLAFYPDPTVAFPHTNILH